MQKSGSYISPVKNSDALGNSLPITFNCTVLSCDRNDLGFTCDDLSKDAGCVAKPSELPT